MQTLRHVEREGRDLSSFTIQEPHQYQEPVHPGSFSIGRLALYVLQRLFVKAEIVAELVEYGKAHLFADDLFD